MPCLLSLPMANMKLHTAVDVFMLAAAFGVSPVTSSPISFCPNDSDVCLRWAVPEAGSETVYFQIEAPTSFQWVGLGVGRQMRGAVMFVMYEDGEGNVTISNREGTGHVMPQPAEDINAVVLDGSGVIDDRMIANVRYSNTGDLDLSGSSSWIMATKAGPSLNSADQDETIEVHDSVWSFSVDLAQASVASDANPFTENNDGNDGPAPDGEDGEDGNSGGAIVEQTGSPNDGLILAHGVILCIVFVGIWPVGSLLMPLLGKWYIHAAWQMVGFTAMWAGFALGYIVANRNNIFFDQTHTRLGIFVVSLIVLQPILGVLHHMQYRRQGKRGIFGHIHIWYGRATILIGIVNGGLGLQLTSSSTTNVILYSVAAGIAALVYIIFVVRKSFKTTPTK
ncbi:hypothetical protein B0I35DRAFT_458824 [Stachybotrys elegans]|uniref:DOMON domain-containing protein n=1 Tax=Stachybotrys elegans TaxID=80388 RepID=A0A8K0SZF9_9HYPO|nr:hypothetical protein B0I35DRAFT_458824 [Stachybotrys elegans]